MSFCNDYKIEILEREYPFRDEKVAFLAAVIRGSGTLHIDRNGVNIEISTDIQLLASVCATIIRDIFEIDFDMNIKKNDDGVSRYTLSIPPKYTRVVSETLAIIKYDGDTPTGFASGVELPLDTKEVMLAYLIGIIASACIFTVPQPTEEDKDVYVGGYHFELDFDCEKMARDVLNILAQLEIFAKMTERGEDYVVYIKDSAVLCDLLALTGASRQALNLIDITVNRSVRRDINRQQNCIIANIDKVVGASQKQLLAIDKIDRTVGLSALAPKLLELAKLRQESPDYSLEQIALELGGDITKSGINHRFRKIIEIADSIDESDYDRGDVMDSDGNDIKLSQNAPSNGENTMIEKLEKDEIIVEKNRPKAKEKSHE